VCAKMLELGDNLPLSARAMLAGVTVKSDHQRGRTMDQYRPICIVISLGMLGFGSYMIYDASTNPLPGGTLALLGGAVFWSLGAFVAFFSWRRSEREKEMAAAASGADGGSRSIWRMRATARRGRVD
jgi:hypothetical protein